MLLLSTVAWFVTAMPLIMTAMLLESSGSRIVSPYSPVAVSNRATSQGAYLHIPFCRRRCYYCDFSIKVVGDRKSTIKREAEKYTSLLVEDIARTIARY